MISEFECFWYVDGTHDAWPMTIEADGLDLKSITIPVQYENGESEVLRFVPERTCREVIDKSVDFYSTLCSECGFTLAVEQYGPGNYCPKCGARVVDE